MLRPHIGERARGLLPWIILALSAGGCTDTGANDVTLRARDIFSDPAVAELAQAAENGDAARVRMLAASGVDVNATGRDGITPLLFALPAQRLEALRALLEAGADANVTVPGVAPVAVIAGGSNSDVLRLMLERGADPNQRSDDREPAIHAAIQAERWANVVLLLEHRADINARDALGATPAFLAASTDQFEYVARLLERGADPSVPDNSGFTLADLVQESRLRRDSDEGKWLVKVEQMLLARGIKLRAR